MNSYSLSDHEKRQSTVIPTWVFSKNINVKIIYSIAHAAACVAIISLLGSLFFSLQSIRISPNELNVANDIAQIDSTLTNIELITQRSKKSWLKKHPTIQYNSTGKVYVNDQETELTAKGEQADSELNTLSNSTLWRTTLILEDGRSVGKFQTTSFLHQLEY